MKWSQTIAIICTILGVGLPLLMSNQNISDRILQIDSKMDSGFVRIDTRLDLMDQRLTRMEAYLTVSGISIMDPPFPEPTKP